MKIIFIHNSRLDEASKKVLLVNMPQGAAKLQAVKVLVLKKIKRVHRWLSFLYDNVIHKLKRKM